MRILGVFVGIFLGIISIASQAEEALCAEVKIEIMQELTMERQGFEALMRITNSLDTFALENVSVKVLFRDENDNPVLATSNTAASNAAFFIRIDDTQDVTGLQQGSDGYVHGGRIAPKAVGELRWLIIPTANAAGQSKNGKLFFVGAELKYSYGGKEEVVDVAADSIVVKPQPALTLDYFLTEQVVGDNGFTPEIEPPEPYILGVRINNQGFGTANNVKIESAQPRIVDNQLGLAVSFKILGSYLKDLASTPSLLINFGNIEPKGVTTGLWIMESNLAGEFKAFNASFTHADELGGELTSLLQGVNANFLVRDVVVDLPGRDALRDFLAYSVTRDLYVFESEPTGANEVFCSNCKKVAEIANASVQPLDSARSRLQFQSVGGLIYAAAPDPFNGSKLLARVVRDDGTVVHPQNAWLSKKRSSNNIDFNYFVNVFDNNASGRYTLYWGEDLVDVPQPPVIQFVADQVSHEGGSVQFLVRATDPNNTLPSISALQLPAGASFVNNAVNEGVFTWLPTVGQAGSYRVGFSATDGNLTALRSVNILVYPEWDTDGDGMDDNWEREHFGNLDKDGSEDSDGDGRTDLQEFEEGTNPNLAEAMPVAPQILLPIFDADTLEGEQPPLLPALAVTNGEQPEAIAAVAIVFEVYSDAALTQLVAQTTLAEGYGAELLGGNTTYWKISPVDMAEGFAFADNHLYYWRAKAVQTQGVPIASAWVKSQFFINTANEAPTAPLISSPALGATIASPSPALVVVNASDVDRDELRYGFELYAESDLEAPVASVSGLLPGSSGYTRWPVAKTLQEQQPYLWRASVTDEHGSVTYSPWGNFVISLGNAAPTAPEVVSPAVGDTQVALGPNNTLRLTVKNAQDPEGRPLSYFFELDTQNTFDSASKQMSPAIAEGVQTTHWQVANLQKNTRYYWRAKANDGEVDSAWVIGEFMLNQENEPPSTPTILNPDNGTQVNSLRPLFEVNPAVDPEGGAISYHFEIYTAADAQTLVGQATTSLTQWVVTFDLADKQTYYWRVRAQDNEGLLSDWSSLTAFSVLLPAANIPPEFSFVLPDEITLDLHQKVLLQWVDADPDSSAKISLFYKNVATNEVTTLVEGIEEDLDGEGDQYWWLTDGVTPGDYQLFAIISDEVTSIQVDACCVIRVQQASSSSSSESSVSSGSESSASSSSDSSVSSDGSSASDSSSSYSSSSPSSSPSSSSSGDCAPVAQCNWYGTLYPVCTTAAYGWNWENGKDCISENACSGLAAPYGLVPACGTTGSAASSSEGTVSFSATVTITNEWDTGYCAILSVTNNGGSVSRWQASASIVGVITNFWGAEITQQGAALNLSSLSWNGQLAAGASFNNMGFCANK